MFSVVRCLMFQLLLLLLVEVVVGLIFLVVSMVIIMVLVLLSFFSSCGLVVCSDVQQSGSGCLLVFLIVWYSVLMQLVLLVRCWVWQQSIVIVGLVLLVFGCFSIFQVGVVIGGVNLKLVISMVLYRKVCNLCRLLMLLWVRQMWVCSVVLVVIVEWLVNLVLVVCFLLISMVGILLVIIVLILFCQVWQLLRIWIIMIDVLVSRLVSFRLDSCEGFVYWQFLLLDWVLIRLVLDVDNSRMVGFGINFFYWSRI